MPYVRNLCFLATTFIVSAAILAGGIYGIFANLNPRYLYDFLTILGFLCISIDLILFVFVCYLFCKTGSMRKSVEELDTCCV